MATSKVNEVINLIKANQQVTTLCVPSLGRTVAFKHLTTGQQERFIQALVDNPSVQSKFTTTLIDVIRENCMEKDIINKLTIIDKYAIGLGLRICSIGDILKTELEEQQGVTYLIDLKKILETIKTIEMPSLNDIEFDGIKITLQYPTLNQEYSNEKYFNREQLSLDSPDQVRSIISTAFIGDIIMFIKSFEISKGDGSESLKLDFNQLSVQDKIELIHKVSSKLLENMLEPMSTVKKVVEKILSTIGINSNDDTIKRDIFITFDASLFVAAP